MNCTKIAADIVAATCGNPPVAGTGKQIILGNFVDAEEFTVANGIISEIAMVAGTQAYSFTTIEDSVLGESAVRKGTYFNSVEHKLTLRIHNKSQANKTFVDNLIGSKVFAIVENLETGTAGEIKYEVYGRKSGLEVSEVTATTDMADETVYMIVLMSPEKSAEGGLPESFFDTDLATTELAIASLLTVGS